MSENADDMKIWWKIVNHFIIYELVQQHLCQNEIINKILVNVYFVIVFWRVQVVLDEVRDENRERD